MAFDPVCGMNVSEISPMYTLDYMGKIYIFCSETCQIAFSKNPMKYTNSGGHSTHPRHGCCC